jgi:hypothetical protein
MPGFISKRWGTAQHILFKLFDFWLRNCPGTFHT